MKITYSNHTDSDINVEKLIEQLRSKEIEFSYVQKLANEGKLSGEDFGKVIVETNDTKGEELMVDMARESIRYQLSLEKNKQFRDIIEIIY